MVTKTTGELFIDALNTATYLSMLGEPVPCERLDKYKADKDKYLKACDTLREVLTPNLEMAVLECVKDLIERSKL